MVHVQNVTACAMTCIKTAGCGSNVSMTDGRLDADVNGIYERHSIFNLIELLIVNQMSSYCNVIRVQ